jgi:hypothetical protein
MNNFIITDSQTGIEDKLNNITKRSYVMGFMKNSIASKFLFKSKSNSDIQYTTITYIRSSVSIPVILQDRVTIQSVSPFLNDKELQKHLDIANISSKEKKDFTFVVCIDNRWNRKLERLNNNINEIFNLL